MRRLAALLVLVPGFVLSQTPEPASPVVAAPAAAETAAPMLPVVAPAIPAAPVWSIGAGVTLYSSSSFFVASLPWEVAPPALGVNASVERRLSRRTWLALGIAGAVSRDRQDVEPGGFGVESSDTGALSLSAGVRRLLTPDGAPVDVSVTAEANAGFGAADGEVMNAGAETTGSALAWMAGVGLGLAVDRELAPNLSLRLATPVVGVGVHGTRVDSEGAPARHGYSFGAGVELRPRLELRLAF